MDDDALAIRLLTDIRHVFTEDTVRSAALVHQLVILEDRPWADGTGGRPITQARVARLLRPFGIHPVKLRFGETTANGYTARMFADAWSRYLPRNVEQRNTTTKTGGDTRPVDMPPETAGSGTDAPVSARRTRGAFQCSTDNGGHGTEPQATQSPTCRRLPSASLPIGCSTAKYPSELIDVSFEAA